MENAIVCVSILMEIITWVIEDSCMSRTTKWLHTSREYISSNPHTVPGINQWVVYYKAENQFD